MTPRLLVIVMALGSAAPMPQAPRGVEGYTLVTTSIRTNDTEVFLIDPHVIDVLHYQSAIDGSRAEWRRRPTAATR